MIEKEILSFINLELFNTYKKLFIHKFGEPKIKRRLAIQITDFARKDLDTRIRITNGQVEIMQKIGDWEGDSFEELSCQFIKDPEEIYKLYKILATCINSKHLQTVIIQMENYIFDTNEFELKLTHQSGKKDIYSYEVEVKDFDKDPIKIAKELDLEINLPENTREFWEKWNKDINLSVNDLRKENFINLIKKYIIS